MFKSGTGIDLSKPIEKGIYWIGNFGSNTINPPFESGTACIIISDGKMCDLVIGVDGKFMCGRYAQRQWARIM